MSLALFAPLVLALAQEKPTTLSLPHDWPVGTRLAIEMTRGRTDYKAEKLVHDSATQTSIEFEILARREDGYTHRWRLGKSAVVVGPPPTDPLSIEVMALNEGLEIEFKTDATGSVTGLVAPEKLESRMTQGVDRIRKKLTDAGVLDEATRRTLDTLQSSMRGPAYRQMLLREPTLVYMPSGASLALGTKRTYEDHLPNPFGGEPLPALGYLQLREVRAEKHEAVVEWRLSIDAERSRGLLEQSMRDLAQRTGKPPPPADARVGLQAIEDAATYLYDTQSGWPIRIDYTRTSVVADQKRVDSLRFDLKPAEKAK